MHLAIWRGGLRGGYLQFCARSGIMNTEQMFPISYFFTIGPLEREGTCLSRLRPATDFSSEHLVTAQNQQDASNVITALKIQKKNKERVNVFLDGEYAFAVSLTAALALKKGQQLTRSEISQLQHADQYSKAYDRALRYLGYRARSQQEVKRYLTEKEFDPKVVAATVERLLDQGYLDDLEFARSWLRDRARLRPRGARGLRYELRQKGVENDVIDQVLDGLDEEDAAWTAVQPKLARWLELDEQTFKRKLAGFLGRRGFNYDTIRSIGERALSEEEQ